MRNRDQKPYMLTQAEYVRAHTPRQYEHVYTDCDIARIEQDHRACVECALMDDYFVPIRVLDDYPELVHDHVV